jgi:ADP-L-glycero-D-manno-heptose 6-epimerase
VPFPEGLLAAYQAFTQADLTQLRGAGYTESFMDVASGVKRYLDIINK